MFPSEVSLPRQWETFFLGGSCFNAVSTNVTLALPPRQMYSVPQYCLDQPAKLHTYCAGAPKKVGKSLREHVCSTWQALVAIAPYPLD